LVEEIQGLGLANGLGIATSALAYFKKAARYEPSDLYVKHELFAALQSVGKDVEAICYLEKEKKAVRSSPPLAYDLLNAYLGGNNYAKFDALCKKLDFSVNSRIPGPDRLWLFRYIQEAIQLAGAGYLEQALGILKMLKKAPSHMGIHRYDDVEDDRRYYHMGCIYEKMGNIEEARRCWEESVSVPHYTGYEPAYGYEEWNRRYFQALSLQKLGRKSEVDAFFDAMELLAQSPEIPVNARQAVIDLVERGRFCS